MNNYSIIAFLTLNNGNNEIAFWSPLHLLPTMLVLWSANGMADGIPLSISVLLHTLMISVFWPNSIDDVECSLHRLETSAAEICLTINYNKTKVMHLGQSSARHVRFANGDPVDSCDKFEYLGVPTSNAETVFRSRLSKAWAAATKLRSILNYQANDSTKIGLRRSAVQSILLYGLECLPLTLTLQDKLDSAYRRILRYAHGVHFPVCISNAELARRTGATALS